jgi:hypothetical protein
MTYVSAMRVSDIWLSPNPSVSLVQFAVKTLRVLRTVVAVGTSLFKTQLTAKIRYRGAISWNIPAVVCLLNIEIDLKEK